MGWLSFPQQVKARHPISDLQSSPHSSTVGMPMKVWIRLSAVISHSWLSKKQSICGLPELEEKMRKRRKIILIRGKGGSHSTSSPIHQLSTLLYRLYLIFCEGPCHHSRGKYLQLKFTVLQFSLKYKPFLCWLSGEQTFKFNTPWVLLNEV